MRAFALALALLLSSIFSVRGDSDQARPAQSWRACERPPEIDVGFLVFFDSGSASLSTRGKAILTEFTTWFAMHHGTMVGVRGHTDGAEASSGPATLGGQRAEAVIDFLRLSGVPDIELYAKDVGASLPLVAGLGAQPEPQNRRVEFVIAANEADASRKSRSDCANWLITRYCAGSDGSEEMRACGQAMSYVTGLYFTKAGRVQ